MPHFLFPPDQLRHRCSHSPIFSYIISFPFQLLHFYLHNCGNFSPLNTTSSLITYTTLHFSLQALDYQEDTISYFLLYNSLVLYPSPGTSSCITSIYSMLPPPPLQKLRNGRECGTASCQSSWLRQPAKNESVKLFISDHNAQARAQTRESANFPIPFSHTELHTGPGSGGLEQTWESSHCWGGGTQTKCSSSFVDLGFREGKKGDLEWGLKTHTQIFNQELDS